MTENFTVRFKQENLANKNDNADFVEKKSFYEKITNINKKITLNKRKHLEIENKLYLNWSIEKALQISKSGYNFLLVRMYFTGNYSHQNVLFFIVMLNSLKLDNTKKVTNFTLTGELHEKFKPFNQV